MISSLSLTINSSLAQPVQAVQTKQALSHEGPLLRFSFAKFLANPCGLMSSSLRDNQATSTAVNVNNNLEPSSQTDATDEEEENENIPMSADLSQEALDLIDPFRQHYNLTSSSFKIDERVVLLEEFLLVLQEVKHRMSLMHPRSVNLNELICS